MEKWKKSIKKLRGNQKIKSNKQYNFKQQKHMKKLALSLAFLSLCTASNAQNVTIPDANFKAYLVGNTLINTNEDTEIQVSEAAAFAGEFYCNNLDIA